MRSYLPLALIVAFAPFAATPVLAAPAPQMAKADALNDKLTARLGTAETKVTAAAKAKHVTPAQAAQMRRNIASIRTGSARLVKQQGFLSAAESASYNRELDAIDAKLGR